MGCFFFFFLVLRNATKWENWFSGIGGGSGEEGGRRGWFNVQVASFRRHISMNCLISETSFGMMGEFELGGGGKESVLVVLLGNFRLRLTNYLLWVVA